MTEKIMFDTWISGLSALERKELDEMGEQYVISGFNSLSSEDEIPTVKGFVRSPFAPLIHESILRVCKEANVSASIPHPQKKGVIASSMFTDAVTEQESWKDLLGGRRLSPIMLPQSVPSVVIGYVASIINIHGPMTSTSINHPYYAFYMLRQAWDWLREGDAETVILTFCDVPSIRRTEWLAKHCNQEGENISLVGGAVSIVMEAASSAASRQVEKTRSIKETLFQILSSPFNLGEASHSMVEAAAANTPE